MPAVMHTKKESREWRYEGNGKLSTDSIKESSSSGTGGTRHRQKPSALNSRPVILGGHVEVLERAGTTAG